ncbi:GOS12 [Symbiodinium pilosum]|uniref:GOS12 protein n=1 Tax=Symbiodinium pilosum TaxID=2952 RepID=A0A812ITL2_SYMPI|nr:GOS12 [Symbiodinium pilosum]
MASWESLKGRAKALKSELDTKMQDLGRLNKRLGTATASTPADRVAELDGQIKLVVSLREEVERGLSQLEDASESLANVAATSAQAAQAARFRETHQEMLRDFKRVAQSIDQQYQHARLLPHSRNNRSSDDAEDGLMRERMGLNSSLSMADEIIGQATATRDMLMNQRSVLNSVGARVGTLSSMFPGINNLIDKISDRKNKERVVLSLTIASCCFFTIWYKFL